MNNYFYPAKFSKEGNAYNVTFLDFDNVFTFGIGFADAYYMAQDALYNILPDLKELPTPTYDYMNIKVKKNEFITMVELNIALHEQNLIKQLRPQLQCQNGLRN